MNGVKVLRPHWLQPVKKYRRNKPVGLEELERRRQCGLDLWTGLPLSAGSKDAKQWRLCTYGVEDVA